MVEPNVSETVSSKMLEGFLHISLGGAGRTLKSGRWRQGARGGGRTWSGIKVLARGVKNGYKRAYDTQTELSNDDDPTKHYQHQPVPAETGPTHLNLVMQIGSLGTHKLCR